MSDDIPTHTHPLPRHLASEFDRVNVLARAMCEALGLDPEEKIPAEWPFRVGNAYRYRWQLFYGNAKSWIESARVGNSKDSPARQDKSR